MNKKLIIPLMISVLALLTDIAALVKGIAYHESWLVAAAGMALLIIISTSILALRNVEKQLKVVRVKK